MYPVVGECWMVKTPLGSVLRLLFPNSGSVLCSSGDAVAAGLVTYCSPSTSFMMCCRSGSGGMFSWL